MFNVLFTVFALAAAAPTNVARSTADTYTITMVNNCQQKVWPAGWQTNKARGILDKAYMGTELDAGKNWTITAPVDAYGLQFWARQECTGSQAANDFVCNIGDCSGYQCTDLNWRGGVIQAEFGSGQDTSTYNTAITSYDLSAIGGNNVGMKLVPSLSQCLTKTCPLSGCDSTQAWHTAGANYEADTTCSNAADFTLYLCPS